MTFEVEQRIYKVIQDHETRRVSFLVYGREEKDLGIYEHILSHAELYSLLLGCVHEFQDELKKGE